MPRDVSWSTTARTELNTVENYLRYLSEPTAAEYLGFSMESEQVMDVAAQVLERETRSAVLSSC